MTLAVHTGVPWQFWLADPAAMMTAAEILAQQAEEIRKAGKT